MAVTPYLGCPRCKAPVTLLSISCGADPHRKYLCSEFCGWRGRTGGSDGPKYVMPSDASNTVNVAEDGG